MSWINKLFSPRKVKLRFQVGQTVRYNPAGEGERTGTILAAESDPDLPFHYEVEDPEEPGLERSWPVKESEILGLVH